MVKYGDISPGDWDKQFPGTHYERIRRRYKNEDWVTFIHPDKGKQEYVIIRTLGYFYTKMLDYLTEWGIEDSFTEGLKQGINYLKWLSDQIWGKQWKKKPSDPMIETEYQMRMNIYLNNLAELNAGTLFEMWGGEVSHLIKQCGGDTVPFIFLEKYEYPGCGGMFLATREDSTYCDKCRKKAHVYNNRKNNKKTLDKIKCEFGECKKLFTPKTKGAHFCSDACRVRNNREKKKLS